MVKPIKEFGGWLRFFQILLVVNMTLMIAVVFMSMLAIITLFNSKEGIRALFELLQAGTILFLAATIFKMLPDPSVRTPVRIRRLLIGIILVFVGFHFLRLPLMIWLREKSLANMGWTYLTDPILVTLWYMAWFQYFKCSKRVLAYYGASCGTELEP